MKIVDKFREFSKKVVRISVLLCLPTVASAQLALPTAMLSDAVNSLTEVAGAIGVNSLLGNTHTAIGSLGGIEELNGLVKPVDSSISGVDNDAFGELQVLEGVSSLNSIVDSSSVRLLQQ